jgi:parallel beta-helix repeat protein
VTSSTASGNGVRGIFVDGDFDSVKSSTALGNTGDGILVQGSSDMVSSSTASENTGHGIHVDGDAPTISHNHADLNGFDSLAPYSDLSGLGIFAESFTTPPTGKNKADGNDDPAECNPAPLC